MAFAHKRRHSSGSSRKLCVLSPSLCYSSLVTDSSEENKQNEDRNQNRNGKNSTNRHTPSTTLRSLKNRKAILFSVLFSRSHSVASSRFFYFKVYYFCVETFAVIIIARLNWPNFRAADRVRCFYVFTSLALVITFTLGPAQWVRSLVCIAHGHFFLLSLLSPIPIRWLVCIA